jgi:hypothetical protein
MKMGTKDRVGLMRHILIRMEILIIFIKMQMGIFIIHMLKRLVRKVLQLQVLRLQTDMIQIHIDRKSIQMIIRRQKNHRLRIKMIMCMNQTQVVIFGNLVKKNGIGRLLSIGRNGYRQIQEQVSKDSNSLKKKITILLKQININSVINVDIDN